MFPALFFQNILLFSVLVPIAVMDFFCRRIPNLLLFFGFAGSVLCRLYAGFEAGTSQMLSALILSFLAACTAVLVLLPFYYKRMIGGGDVKLISFIMFAFPSMKGIQILFYMFLTAALWLLADGRRRDGRMKKQKLGLPLGIYALAGAALEFLLSL